MPSRLLLSHFSESIFGFFVDWSFYNASNFCSGSPKINLWTFKTLLKYQAATVKNVCDYKRKPHTNRLNPQNDGISNGLPKKIIVQLLPTV